MLWIIRVPIYIENAKASTNLEPNIYMYVVPSYGVAVTEEQLTASEPTRHKNINSFHPRIEYIHHSPVLAKNNNKSNGEGTGKCLHRFSFGVK